MLNEITKKQFLKTLEKVSFGKLDVSLPDGSEHTFCGSQPGPEADLFVHDWAAIRNLSVRGDVGFADSYREGLWESSNLENLFAFALKNEEYITTYVTGSWFSRLREQFSYLFRRNSLSGSRRNIQAHYDLGNHFYSLWLDPTMSYSSALYDSGDEDLMSAQINKYDRLIDRLEDSSGSILEIGCGWGGFAERALDRTGCRLKGLTLSNEQYTYAVERVAGQAEIALQDYRQERGIYDNIVSIEMFEAVGVRYWKQYFEQVKCRLKRGGKALIQSIIIEDQRFESYRKGSDMIRSYIFPGGMLPSDERFTAAANESGLQVRDRFEFGKDYARTLEHWLRNFEGAEPELHEMGYDDGFMRIWRYYLASCAASFRDGRIGVMQYELSH